MNLNRQRGVAQLFVVAVMAFLALGLPLTTKLVQQNQENRSQAQWKGPSPVIVEDRAQAWIDESLRSGSEDVFLACNPDAPDDCPTGYYCNTRNSKCEKGCPTTRELGRALAWGTKSCGIYAGNKDFLYECTGSGKEIWKECQYGCDQAKKECITTPSIGGKCDSETPDDCPIGYYCNDRNSKCEKGCPTTRELGRALAWGTRSCGKYTGNKDFLYECTSSGKEIGKQCQYGCDPTKNVCKSAPTPTKISKCTLGTSSYSVGFKYCDSRNGGQIGTCLSNGAWGYSVCPNGCVIGKSVCNPTATSTPRPVCTLGMVKCSGNSLQICRNNAWQMATYCSYGCVNGVCKPAPTRVPTKKPTPTSRPVSVNGRCGLTRNSCSSGSFSDVADSPTSYLWRCLGKNGGISVSCLFKIPSSGR